MKKSVLAKPEIDKRRLNSRLYVYYPSLVNIAHMTYYRRPFNIKFLKAAVFNYGYPAFLCLNPIANKVYWTAPDSLDTFLSGIGLFLEVVRAEIAQTRMPPPTIVEQLDVLDNCCFGLRSGPEPSLVD